MGSPKRSESVEFDKKFIEFWKEYCDLRKGPQISLAKLDGLILKYELSRKGKPINNKGLSTYLTKHNLLSQRTWFNAALCQAYDSAQGDILAGNFEREDLIIKLSEEFGRPEGGIRSLLDNSGRGTNRNKQTRELYRIVQQAVREGASFSEAKEAWGRTNTSKLKGMLETDPTLELPVEYFLNTTFEYHNLQEPTLKNFHLWGLIFADGTVCSGAEVAIRLVYLDSDYLIEISKSLVLPGSSSPKVSEVITKDSSQRYSDKPCVHMTIARKHFTQFVIETLGLPQNKETTDYGLPEFVKSAKNNAFFAFLLGFLEGDGGFTEGTNSPYIHFAVSKQMAYDINEQIFNRLGFKGNVMPDSSIYRLSFNGTPRTMSIMFMLYSSYSAINMKRKYTKACDLWEKWKNTQGVKQTLSNIKPAEQKGIIEKLQSNTKNLSIFISMRKQDTNEVFNGLASEFCEMHEVNKNYMRRLITGTEGRDNTAGWRLEEHHPPIIDF